MRNNLSISDEERCFLVTRCLMNLYDVRIVSSSFLFTHSLTHSPLQASMEPDASMLGKLRSREELDQYEAQWHNLVYSPAIQELHEKVTLSDNTTTTISVL